MNPLSLRLPFKKGRLLWTPDLGEALIPGSMIFATKLVATHLRDGNAIDQHDLGSGLVTDAGVAYLVDDWDTGAAGITNFNYHDSGTGTTAAAVGNTTLETQAGPTTRATGTKSQPTAPQIRTVGTITYAGSLAITEWGLFNQAAQGGTMWDHRVFAAINVAADDSIEFTYTLTVSSGG